MVPDIRYGRRTTPTGTGSGRLCRTSAIGLRVPSEDHRATGGATAGHAPRAAGPQTAALTGGKGGSGAASRGSHGRRSREVFMASGATGGPATGSADESIGALLARLRMGQGKS